MYAYPNKVRVYFFNMKHMAIARERKVASPDLDIFGNDEAENLDNQAEGDSKSMDIFGNEDTAEEAGETSTEESSEDKSTETGTTEGEPDWASIFGEDTESETEADADKETESEDN